MNLLYSHRNFRYIIDETSFKFYFDNMDNICLEVVWRMFLKQNCEVLIKEVKDVFVYVNPARELHNFFLMNVYFQRRFRKRYLYIWFFYIFVFVNVVAMLKIKTIVFYVQRFLLNLQTIRFFLKKFLLIGLILVQNFNFFLELILWYLYLFFELA